MKSAPGQVAQASGRTQVVINPHASEPKETAMAAQLLTIDLAHSDIHFTVRHMVITKVRGRFARWDGKLWLDEQDLTKSRVEISIEAASIDTNEQKRDAHLRSADFLDAEKFPRLTFKSTRVEKMADGKLNMFGNLTIRDVTKPVSIEVENLGKARDPWGNQKIALRGTVAIQREDFGAKWNQALEAGGFLVGKQVDVEIELQAIDQVASAAA
jgi:polyisoprenoid-binding protein YceI